MGLKNLLILLKQELLARETKRKPKNVLHFLCFYLHHQIFIWRFRKTATAIELPFHSKVLSHLVSVSRPQKVRALSKATNKGE